MTGITKYIFMESRSDSPRNIMPGIIVVIVKLCVKN